MTKVDPAEIPASKRTRFAAKAPIMISQDAARQGPMGHQVLYVCRARSSRTPSSSSISLGCTHQAENQSSLCSALKMMVTLSALRLTKSCQSQAWMAWLA